MANAVHTYVIYSTTYFAIHTVHGVSQTHDVLICACSPVLVYVLPCHVYTYVYVRTCALYQLRTTCVQCEQWTIIELYTTVLQHGDNTVVLGTPSLTCVHTMT